jgi:hypothetical protein
MPALERLIALCPLDGSATGGVEALYQLIDAARRLGADAYLASPPFLEVGDVPDDYRRYDAPQLEYSAINSDDLVVIPEIWARKRRLTRNGKTAIWWLSIDNAFRPLDDSRRTRNRGLRILVDAAWRGLASLRISLSVRRFRKRTNIQHLFQSQYAADFWTRHGIEGRFLTDYISDTSSSNDPSSDFSDERHDSEDRPYLVAINPRKGIRYAGPLIELLRPQEIVVLKGMDRRAVGNALRSAQTYLDLGAHPGRDRIPREAALAGCVVIVAKRGSAENSIDIPIDDRFKVALPKENAAVIELRQLIEAVGHDFQDNQRLQDSYRDWIRAQQSAFYEEVRLLLTRNALTAIKVDPS